MPSKFSILLIAAAGLSGFATWSVLAERNAKVELRRERIVGEAARQYVAAKAQRKPAFQRLLASATDDLATRGFTPSEEIVVFRHTRVPTAVNRLLDALAPSVMARQTYYPGEGEVILTAWDDGNAGTWAGNIYAENYDHGNVGSISVVYDIGSGVWDPDILWASGDQLAPAGQDSGTFHGVACNSGYVMEHVIRHAAQRAGSFCVGAMGICALMNISFWICMGGTCGTAFSGYVVEELAEYHVVCVCPHGGGLFCP